MEPFSVENTCRNGCGCALASRFAGQMIDCMCRTHTDAHRCVYADEFAGEKHAKILAHSVCTDAVSRPCAFCAK